MKLNEGYDNIDGHNNLISAMNSQSLHEIENVTVQRKASWRGNRESGFHALLGLDKAHAYLLRN
jgi:hypothetical protein